MEIKEICYVCGSEEKLTIHHIRDIHGKHNKKGRSKVKGKMPLCRKCHDIVEDIVNKNKSKKLWYQKGYNNALEINKARWKNETYKSNKD